MPINEQSKQEYLQARDVFVESYKDFLRKLLGLLDEAEQSTDDAGVRQDVAHFADEVKVMQGHLQDFRNDEERAQAEADAAAAAAAAGGGSASSEGTPRGTSQEDDHAGRASSPGETADEAAQAAAADAADASREDSGPDVPLIGGGGVQSTTSSVSQQQQDPSQKPQSKSKSQSQSQESADELQAEVESQPSQLSVSDEVDETPLVLAPAATDDSRVVSAFCAFRYHKAEFRQLFMRQGTNNSAAAAAAAAATRVAAFSSGGAAADGQLEAELANNAPEWLGPLAEYALHLMRAAFRTAPPDQWEALKAQLAGYGFKAEAHFAMWLRLSASTDAAGGASRPAEPSRVFDAIPPLTTLPKRLAAETLLMLQTLNLLSE